MLPTLCKKLTFPSPLGERVPKAGEGLHFQYDFKKSILKSSSKSKQEILLKIYLKINIRVFNSVLSIQKVSFPNTGLCM